jgi:hypothetical protein
LTLRQIAAQLNRDASRRGAAWRHQYVGAVLETDTRLSELAELLRST